MIKILELFGGIGACSSALTRLGIEYEIADYVEIDKYAVKSYNAIHGTNFEPQDITTWDKDIKVDLIMHGSPCQDFSLAGKQAGGDKDSGTRSSLMYETIRIVEKLKPKYVIWENVKNLLSKKHRHNFDAYLETMKQLGYTNYYQILNAKDYGIPQNRERVFTVSILKESIVYDDYNSNIRKDQDTIGTLTTNCGSGTIRNGWKIIEHKQHFEFPPKQELKLKLKDMLEDEVDEKYYISDGILNNIIADNQAGYLSGGKWDKINESCRRYYKEDGLSPTIHTCQGGNTEPKVLIKKATKQGYKIAYEGDGVNISSRMKYQRCNVQKESIQTLTTSGGNDRGVVLKSKCKRLESLVEKTDFEEGKVLNMDLYNQTTNENISQCLTEPHHNSQRLFDGLRIRKLTPKECWRLMGFDDEDFEKAAKVNSNTQLYKQAGNSIVVNVLMAIFKELIK